jgi:predicted transcriptional regulator
MGLDSRLFTAESPIPNFNLPPASTMNLIQRVEALQLLSTKHQRDMENAYREIGEVLREKRRKAGFPLRSFAVGLGVSAPYLSDMERGNRRYSQKHVAMAVELLEAK